MFAALKTTTQKYTPKPCCVVHAHSLTSGREQAGDGTEMPKSFGEIKLKQHHTLKSKATPARIHLAGLSLDFKWKVHT